MQYFKKAAFSIVLVMIVVGAFAQNGSTNYQQQYLNAKTFFKEGKYNLAQEAFKPVVKRDSQNPFSAYASFYYALSAYHQGYLAVARDMLIQLKRQYPAWNNIKETNFWLATIYFELGENSKAFWALQSIKGKEYAEDIAKLKFVYLTQVEKQEDLKTLYKEYPNDKAVGETLAKKIVDQPIHLQDEALLMSIIKKFKLDKEAFNISDVPQSELKETYTVAVLLPLMVDDLSPKRGKKSNQFVLDLYEGIRLAMEDLKARRANIVLKVFDTKRDEEQTRNILYGNDLSSVDLIVGPLYPGPSRVALDFSRKNKVNIVNPLSSNSEIIGNNPFSFLFTASNETIGRKAGEYAVRNFPIDKPGIIFYGDSPADSIRAYNYKQEAEAGGMEIVLTKKIGKENKKEILKLLTTTYELNGKDTEEYVIARDSIGSIYVASDKGGLASNTSSAVEIRGDSILLLGSSKWLDYGFVNYNAYEKMGVCLIAPDYMDTNDDAFKDVRDRYLKKYAALPSANVLKGYEAMMFFGNGLVKYGNYFQNSFKDKGLMRGYLGRGFMYSGANDNQAIPIIKFVDGELTVVNNLSDN